jgi:hypothetical protein
MLTNKCVSFDIEEDVSPGGRRKKAEAPIALNIQYFDDGDCKAPRFKLDTSLLPDPEIALL